MPGTDAAGERICLGMAGQERTGLQRSGQIRISRAGDEFRRRYLVGNIANPASGHSVRAGKIAGQKARDRMTFLTGD